MSMHRCWSALLAGTGLFMILPGPGVRLGAAELTVDFSRPNGIIRPLHGVDNGPLCYGELVDLTAYHKELAIPFARLHDSAWPYPDIVDIHSIFPTFDADPNLPANYRFGPTDDYLRAITNAGAHIVFRLGESIEHAKRKRYVHPPRDPGRWAAICFGIIRHYNEGWADGHRFDIRYWEIWNEPENPAMWTGTPEQFYRLYATTAKIIKERWPQLKVGGPSLGHQGDYRGGRLEPSEFLRGFLEFVRRERAPLNFFSWHLYCNDPAEPARRALAMRAFLDAEGFAKTESHLNEWNYLPDNDWKGMMAPWGQTRERWYERQGGVEGAAFTAAVLATLQDAPLDVANYYSGDNQPFGLFTLHGAPKKTYLAFKVFRAVLALSTRVETHSSFSRGLIGLAAISQVNGEAAILVSNTEGFGETHQLGIRGVPWAKTRIEVRLIDGAHNLDVIHTNILSGDSLGFPLAMKSPAVALVRLREATAE